ncbi:MAG: uracil-DNA glycosylase [Opitutae bacterium]|nr:uracil-DNA glycosylase [Opitutae bacterium]|tara:strand:+ start:3030 stop:3953 length:924 start_codon:yes stop_codon:yes gene_type:complete
MNLALATQAVLEELSRMRSEGVNRIYIQDHTLKDLEDLLGTGSGIEKSYETQVEVSQSNERVKAIAPLTVAEPASTEVKAQVKVEKTTPTLPPPPSFEIPDGNKEEKWEWLRKKVLECETCNAELNPSGKVVFGEGNLDAELFLCGEAPGAEEEVAGSPFVGPAGELLVKILSAMGLSREKVYLGNILNWRPRHNQAYGNRPPSREEMDFCLPYLKAQLEIVQPKIVMALGKTATDGLLGHDPKRRLSQVRGSWHEVLGLPMMITYHPSYLLHNPSKTSKRKVWEDFLLVMEKLQMSVSEKQRAFFL